VTGLQETQPRPSRTSATHSACAFDGVQSTLDGETRGPVIVRSDATRFFGEVAGRNLIVEIIGACSRKRMYTS
jgi:hypothetical protein